MELVASQEIRLQRNRTENRLNNKASKRDVEFSEGLIRKEDANYRLVSREGEIPFANYIRIDNSRLSPERWRSKSRSISGGKGVREEEYDGLHYNIYGQAF